MLTIWIILAAASCAVSAVSTSQKEVFHGESLILKFPLSTDKLKLYSADSTNYAIIWQLDSEVDEVPMKLSNDNWILQIAHVTFDYEGTYKSIDEWNKVISIYTVKVNTKINTIKCSPGETLSISLEGIKPVDASLYFYKTISPAITTKNGVSVDKENPLFFNRLKVYSEYIKLLNVTKSDVGRYQLTDHEDRLASDTTMILVDAQNKPISKMSLISLVILGIPAIICGYCMKKKCCQSEASDTPDAKTPNAQPESVPMCQPVANPSQVYTAGQMQYPPPGQGQTPYAPAPQWNSQPAPPNPNPVYPPGPLGAPVYPPQWNAPPNPPAPVVQLQS